VSTPYGAGGTRPHRPASGRESVSPATNDAIRAARDLKTGRGRREQQRYLLEGVRVVEDALDQGLQPEAFFLTPHRIDGTPRGYALANRVRQLDVPVYELSERLLTLIADTETPSGVIAVAPLPAHLSELPRPWTTGLSALLLDQVRDPGNVGGILRSAGASGVELVVSSEGSVDLFSPKVVRAGAGAHLRLELAPARPYEELAAWLAGWPQVVLADGHAEGTIYDVDWQLPTALIVSNEAHGVSERLRDLSLTPTRIPMAVATESLNVAAAAAIILYEGRRPFLRP